MGCIPSADAGAAVYPRQQSVDDESGDDTDSTSWHPSGQLQSHRPTRSRIQDAHHASHAPPGGHMPAGASISGRVIMPRSPAVMSGRLLQHTVPAGCSDALIDTLFDAYGKPTEQVGYTDGHYCITNDDRHEAVRCDSSLLYGEILSAGVAKLLDRDHLHADNACVLYDLGMGVGKLCMQAFLQYPSLRFVLGVELAFSRYKMAEQALLRLVASQPATYQVDSREPDAFIRVHARGTAPTQAQAEKVGQQGGGSSGSGGGAGPRRVIELRRGNMWNVRGMNAVDVVVLHTELPPTALDRVRRLIGEMRQGARFVTYQDLSQEAWYTTSTPPMFRQLDINKSDADQFATSWSAVKGHHLYCWEKTAPPTPMFAADSEPGMEESKERFH